MIGKRLGRYVVQARVGAGGMGEVYLANDTQLDRPVALKILPAEHAEDPVRRERLLREARLAASLLHPHVAVVHEVFEHDGMLVLAMEYIEGESLRQRLAAGPLPLRQLLRIGAQIADALSAAHRRGVVHRDVKPENVMITPDGLVKVLDFGLARALPALARSEDGENSPTETAHLSEAGLMVGTLGYMAPEQASGHPPVPESDIFALGATLYEAGTGRRPFQSDSAAGVIAAILRDHPPPPSSLNPELPPELDRILERAMAKDPTERYRDARDMGSDLRALRRRVESSESIDSGATPRTAAPRRWRALAGASLVLVVAVAVAIGAWLSSRPDRPPKEVAPHGRLRLLLSADSSVEGLSLSRDGKMIAYTAEEGGRVDLFVSRTSGGGRVRLTDDTAREGSAAFSPDGERLAYARSNPDTGEPEIRVVPTFGGESQLIREGADAPAWSPDGARIACVIRHADGHPALVTISRDGSGTREILAAGADYPFLRHVDWSPDGSRIVVERSQGGAAGEIWLVPAGGGPAVRAVQDPPEVESHGPVFSRNGQALVYSSNRAGATNLWTAPLDPHGEPTRLTSGAGPDTQPCVSQDGRIAFVNVRSRETLIVLRLDTGETREVLKESAQLWAPAFSPDGREIAFSRGEVNGEFHNWIVPTDGGPARQITAGAVHEIYPRFTPDGEWVVYHDWTRGPDRIWRVRRSGGPSVAMTPARNGDDAYADVSPDGKRIVFTRTDGDVDRIYVADLDGGNARAVADAPSTLPRWSPDGMFIAYAADRALQGAIRVVRSDGSGARIVASPGSWPFWFPDGKRLAFLSIGKDGNQEVRVVRTDAGGPATRLESIHFCGRNRPCDVSRDGRYLATTLCAEVASEIWLFDAE